MGSERIDTDLRLRYLLRSLKAEQKVIDILGSLGLVYDPKPVRGVYDVRWSHVFDLILTIEDKDRQRIVGDALMEWVHAHGLSEGIHTLVPGSEDEKHNI